VLFLGVLFLAVLFVVAVLAAAFVAVAFFGAVLVAGPVVLAGDLRVIPEVTRLAAAAVLPAILRALARAMEPWPPRCQYPAADTKEACGVRHTRAARIIRRTGPDNQPRGIAGVLFPRTSAAREALRRIPDVLVPEADVAEGSGAAQ
jgi:hypothetical protein